MSTFYWGGVVSPVSPRAYQALPRALLSVSDNTGDIEWLEEDVAERDIPKLIGKHLLERGESWQDVKTPIYLEKGEFLMPGFVDTHTHAPQFPNLGSGQQYELLDWLTEVTFPMEARFKDIEFAKTVYDKVGQRYTNCGTTTCCYYGTTHLEGTKFLAKWVHKLGQRAFIGKVNMDRNGGHDYVEASAEASIAETRELIEYIRSLDGDGHDRPGKVQPILTPRFAISCTPELLSSLGALAKSDPSLPIQTHISENLQEIEATKKLFPASVLPPGFRDKEVTYAGVYDAFGLLRENTILAHAVHLEEEEVRLIKERNVGISHCPTSNFNLKSGCAKVGMLLDKGIKVGLGTDVSGGFSPSMLTAVQHASMCSKVVAMQNPPSETSPWGQFAGHELPVSALLYLATLGGAEVCNISSRVGTLTPGKAFDAILVSVNETAGVPGIWGADDNAWLHVPKTDKERLEGWLERFLFCGDDRNVRRVFVQGQQIAGKDLGPWN